MNCKKCDNKGYYWEYHPIRSILEKNDDINHHCNSYAVFYEACNEEKTQK